MLTQVACVNVQPFSVLALSNPPSLITFALFGTRHTHLLLEQLKLPEGQSETCAHCLHALATQIGNDDDEQEPHAWVPSQPLETVPHLPAHTAAIGVGTHWDVVGVPAAPEPSPPDSAPPDSAPPDSAPPDSAPPDSAPRDSAPPDEC